jgi:hypothetical protein
MTKKWNVQSVWNTMTAGKLQNFGRANMDGIA